MQGGKLTAKGNVDAFAGIGMKGGELASAAVRGGHEDEPAAAYCQHRPDSGIDLIFAPAGLILDNQIWSRIAPDCAFMAREGYYPRFILKYSTQLVILGAGWRWV